jgi:hypothetical protein
MAILMRGVFAEPAENPLSEDAGLPPVLLQAATPRTITAAAVSARATRRGDLTIFLLSLIVRSI